MTRRQIGELNASVGVECVRGDEEGVGALASESREGRLDLATGAGIQNFDLHAEDGSSRLHISERGRRVRALVGLTSTATRAAPGSRSRNSSRRFAVTSA